MADVLIRDVPDAVLDRLKEKAERRGRSLEEEVRELLVQATPPEPNRKGFHELAAEMRARYAGRPQTDTLELLREDRDR
jgi:plasmid stability protein